MVLVAIIFVAVVLIVVVVVVAVAMLAAAAAIVVSHTITHKMQQCCHACICAHTRVHVHVCAHTNPDLKEVLKALSTTSFYVAGMWDCIMFWLASPTQ